MTHLKDDELEDFETILDHELLGYDIEKSISVKQPLQEGVQPPEDFSDSNASSAREVVVHSKSGGVQNIIRFSTNKQPFTDEEFFHMNSRGG